jgi:hypothetical protein
MGGSARGGSGVVGGGAVDAADVVGSVSTLPAGCTTGADMAGGARTIEGDDVGAVAVLVGAVGGGLTNAVGAGPVCTGMVPPSALAAVPKLTPPRSPNRMARPSSSAPTATIMYTRRLDHGVLATISPVCPLMSISLF